GASETACRGGHFFAVPAAPGGAAMLPAAGADSAPARSLAAAEAALTASAQAGGEPHVRALCHVTRARLESARNNPDAAREAREAAGRAAERCQSPGVLTDLLARTGEDPAATVAAGAAGAAGATAATIAAVAAPDAPGPQDLSPGEHRVLRALCGPLTLREIAAELYVSRNTVKTQVRAIFRKLDAHDRSGAVARARECGVL
ncbi:response regulator transcription factor, partial [Streptomyces sp. NPDC059627]